MTDRIVEPWGMRTPCASGAAWPARTDAYLAPGIGAGDRLTRPLDRRGDA